MHAQAPLATPCCIPPVLSSYSRHRQRQAFEAEVALWASLPSSSSSSTTDAPLAPGEEPDATGEPVRVDISGVVWKCSMAPSGECVEEGDTLLILEAMKTEIRILSPRRGIARLCVKEGDYVTTGDMVARVETVGEGDVVVAMSSDSVTKAPLVCPRLLHCTCIVIVCITCNHVLFRPGASCYRRWLAGRVQDPRVQAQ